MNIIIEGPDGSGKSTLARYLYEHLGWPILSSKGPPANETVFYERVRDFMLRDRHILDRHPVISEEIYGRMRGSCRTTSQDRINLAAQENLIVYSALTLDHEIKGHDTTDHLKMIRVKRESIYCLYERWALNCAHIIYRGDKALTLRLIKGAL